MGVEIINSKICKKKKRVLKTCLRCEHVWLPRADTKEIKICPGCKSPYWNRAKKQLKKKGDFNDLSIL